MYYRGAQAAIVVYDITSMDSFERAKAWIKELQRQGNPNIVIALAGYSFLFLFLFFVLFCFFVLFFWFCFLFLCFFFFGNIHFFVL